MLTAWFCLWKAYRGTVVLLFLVSELDIPYADDVFLRKHILGDRARNGESIWDFAWVPVVMPQTVCVRGFCIRAQLLGML